MKPYIIVFLAFIYISLILLTNQPDSTIALQNTKLRGVVMLFIFLSVIFCWIVGLINVKRILFDKKFKFDRRALLILPFCCLFIYIIGKLLYEILDRVL